MKRLEISALTLLTVMAFALAIAFCGPAHSQSPRATHPATEEHPSLAAVAPASHAKLTNAQATSNPLGVIQAFTLQDLQNALALAQAQTPPDTTAINCYQALITIVQGQSQPNAPTITGGFSAFQEGRDIAAFLANLQSPNGPLSNLNTACAPLILSAQNTLIQLGVLAGIVAKPIIPIP